MNPTEALALLNQATSLLQLNRADHQKIQEALSVLAQALPKPTEPDETPTPNPE